jgi:hypothetical protein
MPPEKADPSLRAQAAGGEQYAEFRSLDEVRRALSEGSDADLVRLQGILESLDPARIRLDEELGSWQFHAGDCRPDGTGDWHLVDPGFRYPGSDQHGCLRREVVVPEMVGGFPVEGERLLLNLVVDYDGMIRVDGRDLGSLRAFHPRWEVVLMDPAVPGTRLLLEVDFHKRSWEMGLELRRAALKVKRIQDLRSLFEFVRGDIAFAVSGLRYLPEGTIRADWIDVLERSAKQALPFSSSGDYASAARALADAKETLGSLEPMRKDAPAIIKGPYLQSLGTGRGTVVWETDLDCESVLAYGPEDSLGRMLTSTEAGRHHRLVMAGLEPGREYHLRAGAGGLWSQDIPFSTPVHGLRKFSFVVWGDCDGDSRYHEPLLDLMLQREPDLAVCVGDIGGSYEQATRCLFEPVRKLKGIPFCVAIGNHEYGSVTPDHRVPFFENLLGQPGNGYYFSFDYGNSHFIVLDPHRPRFPASPTSYADIDPGSEQGRWLVGDLKSRACRKADFRFVFIHEPPFAQNWEGTYYDGEEGLREHLAPLMDEYRVSVVFSGHSHDYERGRLPLDTGPYYVITGGANNNLDRTRKKTWPHVELTHTDQHFVAVEVHGSMAQVRAIDKQDRIIDAFAVDSPNS